MIKYFLIILTVIAFSCEQQSNIEIVRTYELLEVNGSTSDLSNVLADKVIVTFSDITDTLTKEDLLLNHEFNSSYNPWNKIISIEELNDSTVESKALETNELLSFWKLDTIGYLTRYTLSNQKISRLKWIRFLIQNFNTNKWIAFTI